MTLRYKFYLSIFAAVFALSLNANIPDSAFFNQKGMDELRGNNPAKAAEFFLQAIKIDSRQKHLYNNLAAAYMRMGEYSKAEEYLKISLSIDDNYARALSNMSVTLFHLGRYKESYKYYLLTKKADKEYSEKRFEKKRVSSFINKLSADKPEDEDLKKIKEYMQSGPDGEGEE